jgi:DNA adenine methylase
MAREISKRLRATGADTLVDVFGGSAAVTLNAGFEKRVWNDASADLATLFRVLANPSTRSDLLHRLEWTPVCRRIFTDDYAIYLRGGFSFSLLGDPVDRARATLYRQLLSWGGKGRSGGLSVSTGDRNAIKEVLRYKNVLTKLDQIGDFFRSTCIENLDYQDAVRIYGVRPNCVLFCDPPYDGTEHYYSQRFGRADHVFLAHLLDASKSACVSTYYDTPLIRELYPETKWSWERIVVTKNCALKRGNRASVDEYILTKLQTREGLT